MNPAALAASSNSRRGRGGVSPKDSLSRILNPHISSPGSALHGLGRRNHGLCSSLAAKTGQSWSLIRATRAADPLPSGLNTSTSPSAISLASGPNASRMFGACVTSSVLVPTVGGSPIRCFSQVARRAAAILSVLAPPSPSSVRVLEALNPAYLRVCSARYVGLD